MPIQPGAPGQHLAMQRATPIARARLHISFGNILEMAGAGLGCYAIDRLVGVSWALVAGAVCLLVAAEFVYDVSTLHVPLPRRPRVVRAVKRYAVRARLRQRKN